MKRWILLVILGAVGCGGSSDADVKRARAKFWGLGDAIRQSQLAELRANIDGDKQRAEAEHNRQRDLEGQRRVAELELIAAGGDPDWSPPLDADSQAVLDKAKAATDQAMRDVEAAKAKLHADRKALEEKD